MLRRIAFFRSQRFKKKMCNAMINKYNLFREGDVVMDFKGSVWGDVKFIVLGFSENGATTYAREFGRPDTLRYRCNLVTKHMRLVGADNRPFRRIAKIPLLKMMSKGVVEARREFNIRVNKEL